MNKSGFAILLILVVLFLVVVILATAWFNHIPFTWQLLIIPLLAGIVGSLLLWYFAQHQRSANKQLTEKILTQEKELTVLREKENVLQIEQKRVEQEITQTSVSTEETLNIRNHILNNIGHELRTPLSVILGYSDIILQKAEQENDEELIVFVHKIKLYTKELGATINDLLQMSEIESGQVGFLLEAFGIDHVIEQAVRQNQMLLNANENDLLLIIPPDISMMIADRDKVRIILENLLNNAAKFTQNGTITLCANRTIIEEQSWIIFQVIDTGIGIPQEKQDQIFQPFSQGDNSITRGYSGAGLGLAISHHYCQLMGGRIEVESSIGEGSTFSVYLPAEITAVPSMYVRLATNISETVPPLSIDT